MTKSLESKTRDSLPLGLTRQSCWAMIAVFVVLAELLHWSEILPLQRRLEDQWVISATPRPARHTALVVLDDQTAAMYSDQPLGFWTPQIGQTLAVLRQAGAKVVGLNMLMLFNPDAWMQRHQKGTGPANISQGFLSELSTGKVVLASRINTADDLQPVIQLPHRDYTLAVPDFDIRSYIGLSIVQPDHDGVVRHWGNFPEAGTDTADNPQAAAAQARPGLPYVSFASLLALHASGWTPGTALPASIQGRPPLDAQAHRIHFRGPPGSIATLSMAELLAPEALDNPKVKALRNKVVIIGVGGGLSSDYAKTPFSAAWLGMDAPPMSGLELQAHTVETLLAGDAPEPMGFGQRLLMYAVLTTLLWWHLSRSRRRVHIVLGMSVLVVGVLCAGPVAFGYGLLMPVGDVAVALLLSMQSILIYASVRTEHLRQQVQELLDRLFVEQRQWRTSTIRQSPMILFWVDQDDRIMEASDVACQRLNTVRPHLIGQRIQQWVRLRESATHLLNGDVNAATRNEFCEFWVETGTWSPGLVQVLPQTVLLDDRRSRLWCVQDAGPMHSVQAAIAWRDNYDMLTQLPRRRHFLHLGTNLLQPQQCHAVVAIQVNHIELHFPGHQQVAHETLLVSIAQVILNYLDDGELASYYADNLFILLLARQRCADSATLHQSLLDLIYAINSPKLLGGRRYYPEARVGLSWCNQIDELEHAAYRAELAIQADKIKHPNGINQFSDELEDLAAQRQALIDVIHHGLAEHRLFAWFQPIVNTATLEIVGCEALLRIRDEAGRWIPPGQVIGVAEDIGMISVIGKEILDQALAALARWRQAFAWPGYVSVNFSAKQLDDPELPAYIESRLAHHGVPVSGLLVEITESAYLSRDTVVSRNLERLRAIGLQLAIDDFGTGYSSISYLDHVNASVLKIDHSFIASVISSPVQEKVVLGVKGIAHALNMRFIAEGVSSMQHWAWLQKHHGEYAQGFLFCRPCPEQDIAFLLSCPDFRIGSVLGLHHANKSLLAAA